MKTKSITIYDYDNTAVEIPFPDKDIISIYVNVVSGDETGFASFADGEVVRFDSSSCRIHSFFDGDYVVAGDDIKKWIEFKFSGRRTKSYERQGAFLDY